MAGAPAGNGVTPDPQEDLTPPSRHGIIAYRWTEDPIATLVQDLTALVREESELLVAAEEFGHSQAAVHLYHCCLLHW